MSSHSLTFVVCAAVLAVAGTQARFIKARPVNLPEVLNRTVCPIRVEIDENPDRVPQRIKTLKCADNPTHWCVKQSIPDHECCAHSHRDHVMECVEITDKVVVRHLDRAAGSARTETIAVSVGCTCMISRSSGAVEAT